MDIFALTNLHEIMDWANNWISGLISTMGYPGLAIAMFLENVFPPIPSEIILPFAGSLSITGHFSLLGITLVGMAGSVTGAWVFYSLGYCLGESRVKLLIKRYGKWMLLSENDFDRANNWFQHHGDIIIFFGRMIPMIRSLISIPAGLARMNPIRFTLFTALGTAFWSFGLAFAGKLFGENWILIDQFLSKYDLIVSISFAVVLIAFLLKKLKDKKVHIV
jgi:membrane protein DedA with SNARE-associated domain